jgi:hypothetical protein
LKKHKKKPKVHVMALTQTGWVTGCGLDREKYVHLPVWDGVTCKKCLKRRKNAR